MAFSLCFRYLLAGMAASALCGCPASIEDVLPPTNQFFFPSAVAVSPDESVLFVVNANSELLYNSGSVQVVDLEAVSSLADTWTSTDEVPEGRDCEIDRTSAGLLQCNESEVVRDNAGVRIGNFAASAGIQQLESGDLRLFVPVRGDPSVTWIDYSDGELRCQGDEEEPLCDQFNRIINWFNDPTQTALVAEPFGVHVDSGNQHVVVSHQALAAVSLIQAPADGSPPQLVDDLLGLFAANSNDIQAAVGVAGRQPGSPRDLIYVTSRSENRVFMLYVLDGATGPSLTQSEYFFLNGSVLGIDSRGIAFNAEGSRGYIVNRVPPLLHILDTAMGPAGFPKNEISGAVEICASASNVIVSDVGRGERVYISCFADGQLWVIDPAAQVVEAVVNVGRGPHALTLATGRKQLYVANFLEDTIAVIDLTPGAATENRMVLRLGRARQAGGN